MYLNRGLSDHLQLCGQLSTLRRVTSNFSCFSLRPLPYALIMLLSVRGAWVVSIETGLNPHVIAELSLASLVPLSAPSNSPPPGKALIAYGTRSSRLKSWGYILLAEAVRRNHWMMTSVPLDNDQCTCRALKIKAKSHAISFGYLSWLTELQLVRDIVQKLRSGASRIQYSYMMCLSCFHKRKLREIIFCIIPK